MHAFLVMVVQAGQTTAVQTAVFTITPEPFIAEITTTLSVTVMAVQITVIMEVGYLITIIDHLVVYLVVEKDHLP